MGLEEVRVDAWKRPGGGQQEGEKTTKRSHTPDDPKGSADIYIYIYIYIYLAEVKAKNKN